ncbi:MAG: T9SS type A sorting domain-containing protein [Chitinophagaceae bacterium]|nr:T9SS type A sorting domain-containing protein [Chitinophagaceae bacterium]
MKTFKRLLMAAFLLFYVLPGVAQSLNLNSLPAATATIFLDTDGHTVSGTSWNYNGPIFCGASGLSVAQVTEIFNRVAEDYRPFAINVTTDSSKFLAAPLAKRMRVILTVSYEWYGLAGGIAFMNSFTWGDDTPCFVFTGLLNYNTRNAAEATSHEMGHTMGLFHQSLYDTNCVNIAEYNPGQGSGETGWAPIMGAGYYQNFTLWNNGTNSYGCNNYQSDLEIITTANNLLYRADDHGQEFPTATLLSFVNAQANINGIVEQSSDRDMFKMVLPIATQFRLDAIPYNVGAGNAGSNLDIQVTLYNNAGEQLNVYNPGTLLNSIIDTFLTNGIYYLKLEGRGNPYAPDYASLGSYSLTANYAQIILPLRKLELRGSLDGLLHQLNWIIDADETIIKQVLEYSTDGISFSSLNDVGTAFRNYSYRPWHNTAIQYRLHVYFNNGRDFYSNIITLRIVNDARPKLIGNIISSSIMVSSPGTFQYSIYDLNGTILIKGKVEAGTSSVMLPYLAAGMYFIRFSKGEEIYTEKLIKK